MKKKILLWSIATSSLFLSILALFLIIRTPSVTIEGKSGPYIEMGAQLNGLVKLSEDKVLVSSRKQGLYTFSPKQNWQKLDTSIDIGEITSIVEANGDIIIGTRENQLIKFKKKEAENSKNINVEKNNITESFKKIIYCNKKIIGLSSNGIFEIEESHSLKKYSDGNIIAQTADCHGDDLLVGTRTTGVQLCSISKRSCSGFSPRFPYPDARGVAWDNNEKTWFAGQYGTPFGVNVLKVVKNKWVPLYPYLGDVTTFVKDGDSLKYVITEKGCLFEYESSLGFKKKISTPPLGPYYLKIGPEIFYSISSDTLVKYDNGKIQNYGAPILLQKADDKQQYGNTYVWDIDIVNDNIVLAATSQIGFWWSSNGGISWQPQNNGIDDLKTHFVKYNAKNNIFIAGTHSDDLYTCTLPCKQWQALDDKNFFNADFQEAVDLDEDRYVIASKAGALIYNAKTKKIEKKESLPCKNDVIKNRVTQFWMVNKTNNRIFLGIYPIPADCPIGVWELDRNYSLRKVYDINEAISGIIYYSGNYYVSSLESLYKCEPSGTCNLIKKLMINRMTISGDILWLATSKGVGYIDLTKKRNDINWVLDIPSQIIKVLDPNQNILLIGTLDSGVLRIKVKR